MCQYDQPYYFLHAQQSRLAARVLVLHLVYKPIVARQLENCLT